MLAQAEGPSTQIPWYQVPKAMVAVVFRASYLYVWVLGPSGQGLQEEGGDFSCFLHVSRASAIMTAEEERSGQHWTHLIMENLTKELMPARFEAPLGTGTDP